LGHEPSEAIDFAFLSTQTLGDPALQGEVLDLYVAQVRAILTRLPEASAQAQTDAAHLLIGSSRGIGAWAAAAAAARYEASTPKARRADLPVLTDALNAACTAAVARLRALRP
jgi:hypothetical protein